MSTSPADGMTVGNAYAIGYRCRDIGYGVEEDYDVAVIYKGNETFGKLTLELAGGSLIYLFPDEIDQADEIEPEAFAARARYALAARIEEQARKIERVRDELEARELIEKDRSLIGDVIAAALDQLDEAIAALRDTDG